MTKHFSLLVTSLLFSLLLIAQVQKSKPKATAKAKNVNSKTTVLKPAKQWSAAYRDGFISSCQVGVKWSEDSASKYCSCMAEKLEVLSPDETEVEKLSQEKFMELAKQCVKGINPQGGWSDAQKAEFTSRCVQTAAKSVGEQKAKSYCDCMLPKVIEAYPNAADVGAITPAQIEKWAKQCKVE